MKPFNTEEQQYIAANYKSTSIHAMSRKLGCSFTKVRTYMIANNIPTGTFRKNKTVKTNPYRFY